MDESRHLPDKDKACIPIIAMTANAFAEDVQAALNAGMDDHVAKPMDMDILISAITKCSCMDAAGMPPKVLQTDMEHADISATMEADVLKKEQKKPLVK